MIQDDMGDRLKDIEQAEAGRRLLPLVPICVRIDGKGFSRYTEKLNRPYDKRLTDSMVETVKFLVKETQPCIGYTQSDEISLIYYSSDYRQQIFFDGNVQKMTSVLASMTTAFFNKVTKEQGLKELVPEFAFFDCRVWNVPTKMEASNVLLWREMDCLKNAISMAARAPGMFTHKEIMNKNGKEMAEMLFLKGVSFNDFPAFFKRGTFVQRRKVMKTMTEAELANIPEPHRSALNGKQVERSSVLSLDMPRFNKVTNRVEVIFDGADPILQSENKEVLA